jgi:hypothetical protein
MDNKDIQRQRKELETCTTDWLLQRLDNTRDNLFDLRRDMKDLDRIKYYEQYQSLLIDVLLKREPYKSLVKMIALVDARVDELLKKGG